MKTISRVLAGVERRRPPGSPRTDPGRRPRGPTASTAASRPAAPSVPLRPMNSVRSPDTRRLASSTWKKAVRPANSALYAFSAKMAPVSGSIAVTTCGAVFARRSPSTHST